MRLASQNAIHPAQGFLHCHWNRTCSLGEQIGRHPSIRLRYHAACLCAPSECFYDPHLFHGGLLVVVATKINSNCFYHSQLPESEIGVFL